MWSGGVHLQEIRIDPNAEGAIHPLPEICGGNTSVKTFDETGPRVDFGCGIKCILVLHAFGLHLNADNIEWMTKCSCAHTG